MDDDVEYAGRLLAGRYRLPRLAGEVPESAGIQAYDTASGQEVLARQMLLPEVVEAEFLEDRDVSAVPGHRAAGAVGRAARRPADPAVRRAVDAALAASRIPDHPRLDQVYDVFVEGDELWVVSELLPAQPLSELIADRPLPAHRAAEIAADVLAALRTVHAHGWVHRNITPHTVLVCEDGRAMLTGLAAGVAEEALCGHDPLPDPSRTAAKPRGAIPPAAEPGRRPFDGTSPPRLPSAAQSPLPAGFHRGDAGPSGSGTGPARVAGDDAASTGGRSGSEAGGATGSRGVASPLKGARHGEADTGGPPLAAPAPGERRVAGDAGRRGAAGGAASSGTDPGIGGRGGADGRGRVGDPGLDEGYPGGGPAARAARRGAIAAYRAGTQAASARVAAESQGRRGDWWTTDRPPAENSVTRPEPYGPQGRPYGEASPETHGPTALPGPRRVAGPPVPTPWSKNVAPSDSAPHGEAEPVPPSGTDDRYRGPVTSLAAERARQTRMTVVGAVTERWAPEQAGPVHENWRLMPPVGPSADLWALGVLLFRAVQGHPPYPEDDVAELVRLVCAEPPARAEECGPLRPVVESLLRQDPTERPDFEVLRGWLRSMIRSAPEPDVGRHTVTAPPSLASLEPGSPADPRRLPIVRRRGELVRKRRAGRKGRAAASRHAHRRAPAPPAPRRADLARPAHAHHAPAPPRQPRRQPRPRDTGSPRRPRSPLRLGRLLLVGVLMLLTVAVLYAVWFMPERNQTDDGSRRGSVGTSDVPVTPLPAPGEDAPGGDGQTTSDASTADDRPPARTQPQTPEPAAPAEGFRMHEDSTGFRIAVPAGWDRSGPNGRGQVRFDKGEFEMVVVKGRDSTKEFGTDPMAYQSESEPELRPFRTSDWSSASKLRRIDVGDTAMAEGTYTWQDSSGRDVYVRNRAMILGGRYHLVLVIGPADERDAVDRWFEGAVDTYRVLAR